MNIKSVEFIGSFAKESQAPKKEIPEYAFIGRSNVGKSSLINMLCDHRKVAKVSGTPGKTQLINYFLMNENWHLVDLPGYGYAKVSKTSKAKWKKMIERYLVVRDMLQCAFVLLDSRHPLQKIDLEFINWLGGMHIPFVLAYTKLDKLKTHEIEPNTKKIQDGLMEYWEELPQQFLTSATTGEGREEILSFIDKTNKTFFEHESS